MAEDCGVCFDSDYDIESNEFFHKETRTARKRHLCCECGGIIEPGQKYHFNSGKTDGDVWSVKTCMVCAEIRDNFCCGAFVFETLWEEMREQVFPDLRTACLAPLSEQARERVLSEWEKWKGLRK